jgi:hypothetical protein
MRLVRWIAIGALVLALFTGFGYVWIPLLTDGWGNSVSFAVGCGLIGASCVGLLKIEL